ncbi:hypothetical protein JG687_00013591, partial [Phytophthora cactorum]
ASPPSAVVPTADVEIPVPNFAGVRASLDALRVSVVYTEEPQTLHLNHAISQTCLPGRSSARGRLGPQTPDAANAASPFVLFGQHRYDLVRLESSQVALADCKTAFQERRDNSKEIEAVRLRHRNLQIRYYEAVEDFQNRIAGLETR